MVSKRSDGFAARESGAAAIDWVILAVGVFGLALAVYSLFGSDLTLRGPAPEQVVETVAPAGPVPEVVAVYRARPLLYPHFDEAWRTAQIAAFAALDDAALLAAYDAQYGVATGTVNTLIGADYLGVIEAEIRLRGLDLPPGNRSFTELHDALSQPVEAVP